MAITATAASPVWAADRQPVQLAQAETARSFDIPRGSLIDALTAFGQQSRLQVSVDAALVRGLTSPGVSGSFVPLEALSRLLAGMGFTYRADGNVITLDKAPATSSTINLGPVRVEGEASGGSGDPTYILQNDATAAQGYRGDHVSAIGPWEGRKLQDAPYSVSVLSKDLIENVQAIAPEQIFRFAPTAQLGRTSNQNDQPSIMLRGFQVYMPYRDGLLSDYYLGGAGWTTEDTERVEVFSGLSGFLYGPGNVGGMVNLVTKRPTAERLNRITLGNNGGNNYYVNGDFGGPIDRDGRFGYRINAAWQDGETAINNEHVKKRFISGAFDWHVTDKLLWQFDAAYRDWENRGGPPIWVLAGGSRPAASEIDQSVSWSQPWKHLRDVSQRYGTQIRWDASDALTFRAAWRFTKATQDPSTNAQNNIQANGTYTQNIFAQFSPGSSTNQGSLFNSSGQAFADIRFHTASILHKLTIGAQYQHRWADVPQNEAPEIDYTGLTFDHPTYFPKPVQPYVDRGLTVRSLDQSSRTVLIGDDIMFNEQWSLLAGAAYSTINIKPTFYSPTTSYEKSAVTPNLSLIFKPAKNATVYATYIESLEQGGTAGVTYNGAPVVNAGQVFQPLISKQIELGAKATVGGMLLTAAAFQIEKALQYYDLSNPAAIRYVQDGKQRHRGVEFTAFGKVTSNLTLTGGLALLDAKVKEQKQNPALEGKRPINVADTLVKLRAEYQLPFLSGLSVSGGVIYTGPQYGNAANTDRLPSYALFDVGARYEFNTRSHPLTIRLDVQNLTDKAYWANNTILGIPRTVLLSVSTRF
ncbi:MAG: TonB-dependent receptor [Burkholderiaceae bacterium]